MPSVGRLTWQGVRLVLMLSASGLSATRVEAQQPPYPPPGVASAAVATGLAGSLERARKATVSLEVTGVAGQSSGSGILLQSSGIVATAAHVIYGATQVRVRLATGETYEVVGVLDYDERLDAALLAIAGFELPTAELGNADSLQVGQRVIAVGSPLGLEATVTDGIVSAVRLEGGVRRLQISTPVAPGSSGGPLLTEQGRVVGLVVSGIRGGGAENLNFALPINYLRGKLGFVSGKTPTPLGEVRYGSAPSETAVSGGPAGAGVSALTRLNENLHLDFMSLDGAQLTFEEKGQGQLRIKNVVWYALSQDPTGVFVLERGTSRTYRTQGLITGQDFARETSRTVYHIGRVNRFSSELERVSQVSDLPAGRSELVTAGSQYSFQANGGIPRTGSAPPGVFPPDLIGAVTAALPDPLPATVSFWILDPGADRLQEVTLEVLGSSRQKIPVAVQDKKCVDGTPTGQVEVEIVRVRRRFGLSDENVALLARRPHLMVDKGVKCIRLQSIKGPDQPTLTREERPM